ncbi:MAG: transketolase [bacterium]|nr:transketolase [bacterium]
MSKQNRLLARLEKEARNVRRDIVRIITRAGEGHIGPALSCVDILCVLYFEILRVDPNQPNWEERDRVILSKGHGCTALYSVLARRGFFPVEELSTYGKTGTIFGGHPDRGMVYGVEVSTGSLGHGLSLGAGMALAAKVDHKDYRVIVILSDGECQEGSTWEGAMFARMHKLDNLTAIVDRNGFQAIGRTEDIVSIEPFREKWEAFGWSTREVNGHNYEELLDTLNQIPFKKGLPSVIIAHTVKGKGVSFMENKEIWHAKVPSDEEFKQAMLELGKRDNSEVYEK